MYNHLRKPAIFLLLALMACGGNPRQDSDVTESPGDTAEQSNTQAAPGTKLNLNMATEEEFLAIPNVGDRMVHEFFEYRPYVSIRQFRREIGKYVDEEQVAAYEQYVFVPIDPDECDAETLQQIPGVDPTEADELIAARPYESNEVFLEKLAGFVNEEELSTGKSYLKAE